MKSGVGAEVSLRGLKKQFGTFTAVDDVDLTIPAGEFAALLGPSGSGKTTTLNLIAGFESPDGGQINFDGRDVSGVPTHKRDIGMVFQSYALFPHMTVFDNVQFPLRMRAKLSSSESRRQVMEALEIVRLGNLADRYPKQLSGGQQQRVAMARAIISRPRLLLMDEPLGALDKNLRGQLQDEIRRLHRQLGTTFIYVTHDQEEALAMATTLIVMKGGKLAQVGSPSEVYEQPSNAFIAEFLGGANLLPGTVVSTGTDLHQVKLDGGDVVTLGNGVPSKVGAECQVLVRPEVVRIDRPTEGTPFNSVETRVIDTAYQGDSVRVLASYGTNSLSFKVPLRRVGLLAGEGVLPIYWSIEDCRLLSR